MLPAQISPNRGAVIVEEPHDNRQLVPVRMKPEQEALVQEILHYQRERKRLEIEKLEMRATMRRQAGNLCNGIVKDFLAIVAKSPELQAMLNIKLTDKKPLDVNLIVERMEKLLAAEVEPEDETVKDFVWVKHDLVELLEPVLKDMEQFLKLFELDKNNQATKMAMKEFENQINAMYPPGKSPLQMAGTGAYWTVWLMWMVVGSALNTVGIGTIVGGMFLLSSKSLNVVKVIAQFAGQIVYNLLKQKVGGV